MVNEPESSPAANALPRRRSFVAGAIRPPLPGPGELLPELPVLTEIVDPDAALPELEPTPPPTRALDTQAVHELAQEMAQDLARDMAPDMARELAPDLARELAPELARAQLAEILPARRQQAAQALSDWLDAELPGIVTRVLDGLADHIVAQVTLDVRNNLQPRLDAALEHSADASASSGNDDGSPPPWPVSVGPT